ncbi:arsenate reductase family protein [Leptospira wolffii]|uniref:ArsC family transcriptional regulator n=1 Tax=Leptospira wolffii TaxID=409998 RepID=A0A2M9ZEP0_9LEPT|nr:arsenate reductase family protein [Leptospira wolffii]PJZ66911.1 ArsC family transcriptional regulator [Leptospira wolffii]TGK61881.1 arsenate reductase family protein [Leptospira wolffii]TGK67517.1 arsenate reductase family protein [Leptospira wolffii]TGK74735.1 arsenate reductase family protein [Leptospira wolffii]TGL31689.1 arsenate reductase family protein [Leptospira wolffii]
MKLKVYEYKNCSTCRNALKYLESKKIPFETKPIRETPPSKSELKKMLSYLGGESKRLFNTSGGDYKELGLKDKLPKMSLDEQIELLSSNGNLVKRPFVLGEGFGMVGFKEEEWKSVLKK